MFRRFASNLMIVFGCIAFAIVGLGPRGAALCLGGGHALGEMIVAACEGGGHSHGAPGDSTAIDAHACDHHDAAGAIPPEARYGDHGHGPCADIPLDQDEYRASGSTALKHADDGGASAPPEPFAGGSAAIIASSDVPRIVASAATSGPTCARMCDMLRCVILQV